MSSSAGIIIIGDEILSGRTRDTNINWIANELNKLGINLKEARIIEDDKKIIKNTVLEFSKKFTYVFTSGGIGPTHDDITTESIAEAFQVDLEKNKIAMKLLKKYYETSNIDFNEARQKMAIIPKGASLIDNAVSIAPGFNIKNVYVFAGIPKIMQCMFHSISSKLKGGIIIKSKTITCNVGEGKIAIDLGQIEKKFLNMKIGSYPYFNPQSFGTSIVIRSENIEDIDIAVEKIIKMIKKFGGNFEILM
tara:strand:- start:365 stop:1111 length:747 start_codon:yes stop_codon:yes gene_type:complete